jgi:RimJ/RimL family protein N-acetyltransferase
MGVPVITARAMVANEASSRVLEKLGLRFHSHFTEEKFPGKDKAAVKYTITREEFLT